jgi:hypothetical protein
MPRLLTISRVTVAPEREAEYVRTVHLLAELALGRSQRLWLFRSTRAPNSYVEFSEGRSELAHRARASRTDLEEKLERRLREIAAYAPGAWDMWEEVPVPEPQDLSEG